MPGKTPLRSTCPINALVESIGDPWSLLILRDVVLRRRFRYSDFQRSDEGIATNILAERLKRPPWLRSPKSCCGGGGS